MITTAAGAVVVTDRLPTVMTPPAYLTSMIDDMISAAGESGARTRFSRLIQ